MEDKTRWRLKIQFWFHLTYSILLSVLGLYLNSTDYDQFDDQRVKIYQYLRFRLLTIWFHVMLLVYFPVSAYCDWRALRGESLKHVRILDDFRQIFFTALVFPSTWYVDSFFWRIWNLNRELIVPSFLDVLVTPSLQHVLHTLSLVAITAELLLLDWKRPKSMLWHHITLSAYLAIYMLVVIETRISVGVWPYPFMNYMSSADTRILYVVSYAVEHYFFFFVQWNIIDYKLELKKRSKTGEDSRGVSPCRTINIKKIS